MLRQILPMYLKIQIQIFKITAAQLKSQYSVGNSNNKFSTKL